jgi:hypothetical protein
MDRFAALSMLETGDNDMALGQSGEVSRFQIAPAVWREHTRLPLYAGENPFTAFNVVQTIMAERIAAFQAAFHRVPTDFEFYVLWNRPADIHHPKPKTQERATRFANLCNR